MSHAISHLQILHYAREGLLMNIGINMGNPDAAEDLVEWRQDLAEVERRIAMSETRHKNLNKESKP